MEEEVRKVLRERREKSIRFMGEWLEAQSRANAEEGSSRFGPNGLDDVLLSLFVSKALVAKTGVAVGAQGELPVGADVKVAIPEVAGQRLITSFFLARS